MIVYVVDTGTPDRLMVEAARAVMCAGHSVIVASCDSGDSVRGFRPPSSDMGGTLVNAYTITAPIQGTPLPDYFRRDRLPGPPHRSAPLRSAPPRPTAALAVRRRTAEAFGAILAATTKRADHRARLAGAHSQRGRLGQRCSGRSFAGASEAIGKDHGSGPFSTRASQ